MHLKMPPFSPPTTNRDLSSGDIHRQVAAGERGGAEKGGRGGAEKGGRGGAEKGGSGGAEKGGKGGAEKRGRGGADVGLFGISLSLAP